MRTLSRMSAELSNFELGLELELNSDDVAAAEAAVAAHGYLLTCSCCNQELTDKESLHLHHISQHSITQLSIALLALRGFDVTSGLGAVVPQDLCCRDSESESTVSAHSSFMCFAEEFSNSVPEVCALSDPLLSDPNMPDSSTYDDTQCTNSLPDVPQYSSDCGGSYSYGGNVLSVDRHGVDLNSNHDSSSSAKIGNSEADLIGRLSRNSLLTNCAEMSKVNRGRNTERQATFLHDFPEVAESGIQRKSGKNSKRTQLKKGHKTTLENTATAPKKEKLTCAKSTPNKSQKHSTNDYERREFSCDICGRRYKRKSHLGRHIRMHSGVRPFQCTVCDKRFAVRSILKQHMRVHTGERPFKCHICCHRFPQKSGLVTHMMLHTGKPYKCDLCEKSFVSNHKLTVHKRSHEEQSGRWPMLGPHSCPTCSTRFFTSSALVEHANVHKGAGPQSRVAPQPIAEPVAPGIELVPIKDSHNSPDLIKMPDVNANKHNSHEVTAGQALLTLMDSNVLQDDPEFSEEENNLGESHAYSEGSESDATTETIDFEFGDVPMDLKSSICIKEECFEFEGVLGKTSNNRPENN